MVVTITKKSKPKEIEKALLSISKSKKKKTLKDFYGALKRNIDGLTFQKKIRNEWE